MRPSQIIVLATPVFFLMIAVEFGYGLLRQRRGTGRNTYHLSDAINSLSLGMLSQITAVFTRLLRVGIYTAVWSGLSLLAVEPAQGFWTSPWGWLLALLFYDFCYYWLHRAGHECALLWAAHVVHHQSQDYNLSTALRQTSSGALFGWLFYLPMAVAGVPPLVFGVVALVDLLYQFWVHTEQIGRLGWFDKVFCSPSNHRVHHAVNDAYLDRNYGGVLMLWDRMFGTFVDEDPANPCVYGTRKPLNSWDPLWANLEIYAALTRDSLRTRRWTDKLRVWFKAPGWRPPDLAEPDPEFLRPQVRAYNPPVRPDLQAFAALQFVCLLGGVAFFLWQADAMPLAQALPALLVLGIGLWAVGGLLQGRFSVLEVLLFEASALATATAVWGLPEWHRVFKPLAMLLAIAWVGMRASATTQGWAREQYLLLALGASLVGDCFLMVPGYFVPGLAAFLVAHLCFIARLRQGVPWFASRAGLLFCLVLGATMLALLWTLGLPAALRGPVAGYVACITLMAAQATGRAAMLRDRPSQLVAVGALLFMLSDSLLAWNRFVAPLQWGLDAAFWVLGSYYLAQICILRGCLQERQ